MAAYENSGSLRFLFTSVLLFTSAFLIYLYVLFVCVVLFCLRVCFKFSSYLRLPFLFAFPFFHLRFPFFIAFYFFLFAVSFLLVFEPSGPPSSAHRMSISCSGYLYDCMICSCMLFSINACRCTSLFMVLLLHQHSSSYVDR